MGHIFHQLVGMHKKEEIERVLESPEEWNRKAKNAALTQLSKKDYKATKDILLFVIKKQQQTDSTEKCLKVPTVLQHALLAEDEHPPRPRRTEAQPRVTIPKHKHKHKSRSLHKESHSQERDLYREELLGTRREKRELDHQAPQRTHALGADGHISIGCEEILASRDGSFRASLVFGDSKAFPSQDEGRRGSIHLETENLVSRSGSFRSEERRLSTGGFNTGRRFSTLSAARSRQEEATTVTVRAVITHDVQRVELHEPARAAPAARNQRGSAFGSLTGLKGRTKQLGSLSFLQKSEKKAAHAHVERAVGLTWPESVAEDVVHALNTVDWVIRHDQVEVDMDRDPDPLVVMIQFSNSEDFGTDIAPAKLLSENFIAQMDVRGSRLQKATLQNQHRPFEFVSAEVTPIDSEATGMVGNFKLVE